MNSGLGSDAPDPVVLNEQLAQVWKYHAIHLLERVLHQFDYTQTIPRHPSQSADPLVTRNQDHILAHFAEYLDKMLTPEQRGFAAIHPWDAATGYMR
ncbi:hypothetical protein A2U01_0055457, partial [Trifolium medium]|nr:hypothetical protein [Trifolium medium]